MLLLTGTHKHSCCDNDIYCVNGLHRKPSFILFDEENRRIDKIIPFSKNLDSDITNQGRDPFRPFGITSDNNFIYIASNDKICSFDKKTFEYKKLISSTGNVNTHHLLHYNGYIYRCDTSVNCITRIDLKTSEEIYYDCLSKQRLSILPKTFHAKEKDSEHINSLMIHNNKLYVIANCLGKKPSYCFTLDLELNNYEKYMSNLGFQVHDIINFKNKYYALDSRGGNLTVFDTKKNKEVYKIIDNKYWFLRGMIQKKNNIYIFGTIRRPHGIEVKDYSKLIIFNVETNTFDDVKLYDISVILQVQNYNKFGEMNE